MQESTTDILQKSDLFRGITREEIVQIQKEPDTEIKQGHVIFTHI